MVEVESDREVDCFNLGRNQGVHTPRSGGDVVATCRQTIKHRRNRHSERTPVGTRIPCLNNQHCFPALSKVVGPAGLLSDPSERLVYECDGYVVEKSVPDVVVFPHDDRAGRRRSCKVCNELDVPFVPRGAGTSLAGGTLPVGGGVMICLTRMKQILEVNLRDRYAVVEPGVVNV